MTPEDLDAKVLALIEREIEQRVITEDELSGYIRLSLGDGRCTPEQAREYARKMLEARQ